MKKIKVLNETSKIQSINIVKDMSKSKFFWFPIFILVAFVLMFSDVFYGFGDITILREDGSKTLETVFDLNLAKILLGFSLSVLLIKVLHGKGRYVGGIACLIFANFICTVDGGITLTHSDVTFQIPIKLFYCLPFLASWYALTFYAHEQEIKLGKLIKAYFWLLVLYVGILSMMAFFADLNDMSISFAEAFRANEFNLHFMLGFFFILLATTAFWGDMGKGESVAKIQFAALYWSVFFVAIFLSVVVATGYLYLERKSLPLPVSWFTLEMTIVSACFWLLILFNSMCKFRLKQCANKESFRSLQSKYLSKNNFIHMLRIPLWTFMVSLLLSSIFVGFREIQFSTTILTTVFDFNIFKSLAGIVLMFMLIKKLSEKERRVGAWICMFIALTLPLRETIDIIHNNVYFQLETKMIYALIFVTLWFVLLFYSHIKDLDVAIEKPLKAFCGLSLFFIGICKMMILFTDISNGSTSLIRLLYDNEFLNFSIAMALILLSITLLREDIGGGVGSAKIVHDVLFWSLFLVPITLTLFSIWGYVTLIGKLILPPFTQFALEWVVVLCCGWILLLFNSMYKYRIEKCTYKKDSYSFIASHISNAVFVNVLKTPKWLFIASIPAYVNYLFKIIPFYINLN